MKKDESTDDDMSDELVTQSDDSPEEEDETECLGCGEKYNVTTKNDDWIKCLHCQRWFHESCSKYVNLCDMCGKILSKKRA